MRARILAPTPENIATAADSLKSGEVVGMPTETVYGLAGAALKPDALALIFDTKERPTFDPLIIHVGFGAKGVFALERLELIDGKQLSEVARGRAEMLMQGFWPGPLTLVLPKHEKVPELATSGLSTVALRMPAHPVAQQLLATAGMPLAAPSANRFGRISPTTAQAVAEELGDRIDWILDGGPCEIGVESTVLAVESDGTLRLLRPGGLSRARIEEVCGCTVQMPLPRASESTAAAAPGMLDSHYAPAKPLHLMPSPLEKLEPEQWKKLAALASANGPSLGFLLQKCASPQALEKIKTLVQNQLRDAGFPQARITALSLSHDGDLREAARNLFARLRELDASDAQTLFAEPCEIDHGLGHAIADRLGRAAFKREG